MNESTVTLEISDWNLVPTTISEDMKEIPIIDTAMNYKDFFQSFLLLNKPCLIKSVSKNWPCSSNWIQNKSLNVEYFQKNYKNVEVPVSNCGKREYNAQKKCTMPLFDYLDYWQSYKKSPTQLDCLYLKDWHFVKEFPNERVYQTPSYFASDWLNEYYDRNSNLNDDYRFVYIGPKTSWTPFHADVFSSYSWSVNICGRKNWIFVPPGKEKHFTDKLGNLKYDIDLTSIDEAKMKAYSIFNVVQEEGQGVFVPSGWHHQVWNLEDTISINHNWINGCNIHYIWNSLKKNLSYVKKEISDCKDMENWTPQCQLILSSNFGFDYEFFHSFLTYIAEVRMKALKTTEKFSVFGNWSFGNNHLKFDLKNALKILNLMQKDDDFIEAVKTEENLNHSFEFLDSLNAFIT